MAVSRDPLTVFSPVKTPQSQPIPGRKGMIKNNAGGYVFEKDEWRKLEDFLILGTNGGTYYVNEDKLTLENAQVVLKLARERGEDVVSLAEQVSTAQPPRAPKNRPAMFALAAASAFGDAEAVQAVKPALPAMARTTDHLSMFFGYRKQLGGKSTGRGTHIVSNRALRTALSGWFMTGEPDEVAFKAAKARQRKTPAGEDLALRDILRLARPKPDSQERDILFGWLTGKVSDEKAGEVLPSVDKFRRAKAVTTPKEAVSAVTELRVPWEFLPTDVLTSPEVWEALASTTGLTAVMRNLARMTRIGTLKPFSPAVNTVVKRLTSAEAVLKARIHPVDAYLALRVYGSGEIRREIKKNGRVTGYDTERWTPVPAVLDALEETWELSFGSVTPSGRRLVISVDSSGSMSGHWARVTAGGVDLGTPYEVACSIALILKRIEGDSVHIIDVDTGVHESRITKRTSLREIRSWHPSGGGTNLALPFAWASQNDIITDGFAVITDGETWQGGYHPTQALEMYRQRFNQKARVAVAAVAANGHSIGDPQDQGVLNIAGMDSSLPMAVTGFLRGE